MSFDLDRLLKIRRFSTLKRLQAMEVMLGASMSLGLDALNKEVAAAIQADLETLQLEESYRPKEKRQHGLLAPAQEVLLGKRFRALFELLTSKVTLHGEESLQGIAASLLLDVLLPQGVVPTVNRTFADAQHLISRRLQRLRDDPVYCEAVEFLDLGRVLAELGDLNQRFGDEIGSNAAAASVSYEDVRFRQRDGHDRFSRIIFRAIGIFPGRDPVETAKRDRLLAGVYFENETLSEAARRARARRARRPDSKGSRATPIS